MRKNWLGKYIISPRQTNYSPYYKISADARVNYFLTTTLLWY